MWEDGGRSRARELAAASGATGLPLGRHNRVMAIRRVLWELPRRIARDSEVDLLELLGRDVCLRVRRASARPVDIIFTAVEAYRCTYLEARAEEGDAACDKLVDVGQSAWLSEIRSRLARRGHGELQALKHLLIALDGGPCYEVICKGFSTQDADGAGRDSG